MSNRTKYQTPVCMHGGLQSKLLSRSCEIAKQSRKISEANTGRSESDKLSKEWLLDAVLELFQQSHQPVALLRDEAAFQIWLPFVGTSMSPRIKEGDMLLVQHAPRKIRLGDVIVFKRAGRLIAHRVVFIKKHGNRSVYQTKGDNFCPFDALVPQSSVLGRVVRIKTHNRTISLEKLHIKIFSFGLALASYACGIFLKALKRFRGNWRIWP